MKLFSQILLILGALVVFSGCSETQESETSSVELKVTAEKPDNFESLPLVEKIEFHIENDQYDDALNLLRPLDENDQQIKELLIATHMTYGLNLTYGSLTDQRTRMPEALRQFRRVLELDPSNTSAQAEIDQIEGIYLSMNREIPQGVAE
jgi:tetratricopeptide (TPR) repeat protein